MLNATAALGVMAALATATCTTAESGGAVLDDLSKAYVDPLECTTLSLKSGISITKEIIHEPSVMKDRFMVVLRYREGGDEKSITPAIMPGYVNISFVSEVEQSQGLPLIVYQRYCILEVWRLYPKSDRKICYLWNIGDRGVSFKLMLEDIRGRFLAERDIPLAEAEATQLRLYASYLMKELVKTLKEPPPDL